MGRSCGFYMPPDDEPSDGGTVRADGTTGPREYDLLTSKKTGRELRATLRTLDRRATQEYMDKGIWILYLAVGILHWADPDSGEEAESPLVLVPVRLARESPREPYELKRADEDIVPRPFGEAGGVRR
jgi:hypothetical protein